jgi:hypothetical protein|nr:MAG: hypothetical protein [Bacteriophage sp.]
MDNELLNYKISEDKDYAGNVAVTTTGRVERLVLTCYLQGKYCIVTEYNGEYSIVMKEGDTIKVSPIFTEIVAMLRELPRVKELE